MKMLYDNNLSQTPLQNRTVAVIGYGSQGRAQALCLRDSGVSATVGVRPGQSESVARADGFASQTISEAVAESDVVALLVPDSAQPALFKVEISPNLRKGAALVFAHGFNLLYHRISMPPEADCVLVAPMGAGPSMRALYQEGSGVSGYVSIFQDVTGNAREIALAYAKALGCGRIGVMEGPLRDEVETDLFGEQAVLCGGLTALAQAGFDTLIEAGYPEELAYFECVHQIKLLADLIHAKGIAGMRANISDTALFGDLTRGPRVIGDPTRAEMRKILDEIRSAQFAQDWIAEQDTGSPKLKDYEALTQSIDNVGKRLRREP